MDQDSSTPVTRREALTLCAATAVGAALPLPGSGEAAASPPKDPPLVKAEHEPRAFGEYTGERFNRVAFPLGGMGAGMICLEGSGALSHFSLRNKPEVFHEPCTFAAICIKGPPKMARVLEGPVPGWKLFGQPGTGNGAGGTSFGLPRFRQARFQPRFPFGTVTLCRPPRSRWRSKSPAGARSSRATPTPPACPWPPWSTASPTRRPRPWRRSSRGTPGTSWPFAAIPQAVRSTPGGFMLWGGRRQGRPSGGRALCRPR